jgi:primosomal protein N' (replication factor Y) (superfamily II helicase)
MAPLVQPGVRARVLVGKRRLVGVIVALPDQAPAGVTVRPLEAVLDHEPILPPDLLDLARFVADYYLATLGEVLRSVLPADLEPWGDQRVWLTNAGAMAPPRNAAEESVIAALRAAGRLRRAELQAQTSLPNLSRVLNELHAGGRIVVAEDHSRRGTRYVRAVELPSGDLATQLVACGRSEAGRMVISWLAAIGRPATDADITSATGASRGVVERLLARGILRAFTQAERLSLDQHVLGGGERPVIELRADQQAALAEIEEALHGDAAAAFLLRGQTGAGKTEVYLCAAESALRRDRSSILLVPEIALVPALARAARERFGSQLALLHSNLGGAERGQEWERIRSGLARVVVGPRSALFAPVSRLGLLVVDEEQDAAYKQDLAPRYHGRDVALVRGRAARAVTVLVSATPSLEARHNVDLGKLRLLELSGRAGQGAPPEGILVDLRAEGGAARSGEVRFSARLLAELEATFAAGDQAILLRNRRGYAPMLLCRACGEDMRCADCGLPRTYHRRDGKLLCHYCGSRIPVPERCPTCHEATLEAIGAGTERVEERFRELFPNVPVDVLDRDTLRRKGGVAAVLERFASGELRALIGTQMVSKGHHFPGVVLTAVLAADSYLGFPDFRAVERTYSMLTQLAGRAGRGQRPGRVVIQTYHPEHYAIRAALERDDRGFAEEELRFRRLFHYPPFSRMVQLLLRDSNRVRGEAAIGELAAAVAQHPLAAGVRITGPAPAPFERLRGKWRFQLLLRANSAARLNRLVRELLPGRSGLDLTVDVDPLHLL